MMCTNCINIGGVLGFQLLDTNHLPHECNPHPLENLKVEISYLINKVLDTEGRPFNAVDVMELTTFFQNHPIFKPLFGKYPRLHAKMCNSQIRVGWVLRLIAPLQQLNTQTDLMITAIKNDSRISGDNMPLVPARVFLGFRRMMQDQITSALKLHRKITEWIMDEYFLGTYDIEKDSTEPYGIPDFKPTEISPYLIPATHPLSINTRILMKDLIPDEIRDPSEMLVPSHRYPELRTETEQMRAIPLRYSPLWGTQGGNVITIPPNEDVTEAGESSSMSQTSQTQPNPPKPVRKPFSLKDFPFKKRHLIEPEAEQMDVSNTAEQLQLADKGAQCSHDDFAKVERFLRSRVGNIQPEFQPQPTCSSTPVNFSNAEEQNNNETPNKKIHEVVNISSSTIEVTSSTDNSEVLVIDEREKSENPDQTSESIFDQTTEVLDGITDSELEGSSSDKLIDILD